MHYIFRTTAAVAIATVTGFVQPLPGQSPFNTGDATGSITTPTGGFLQANFTKNAFRIGYAQELTSFANRILGDPRRASERPRFIPRYGFEFEATPAGDAAPLLRSGDLSLGAKATLSFGLNNILSHQLSQDDLASAGAAGTAGVDRGPGPMTFDWVSVRLSYGRNQYSLLDPSAGFSNQIVRRKFDGLGALVSYNAQFGGLPSVLGIAFGVEQTNNAADLQQVEIQDQVFTSSSGTTVRTARTVRKVLRGDFEESTSMSLNTDFVVLPPRFNARVAFDAFTRTDLSGSSPTIRPGLGVFLTQKDAPTKVVGGISFFRDKEGDLGIDLVAGFNFD